MNYQTWTDEQLQEHLMQWTALTGEDRNALKITLSTMVPDRYPFTKTPHKLSYEDTTIALTFLQALRVSDWMQEQYELHNSRTTAKHDGQLGGCDDATVSYDGMSVAISTEGPTAFRDIFLDASQALLLLAWLEQERETLEQMAKEQAS